jgi:hypothetical protein
MGRCCYSYSCVLHEQLTCDLKKNSLLPSDIICTCIYVRRLLRLCSFDLKRTRIVVPGTIPGTVQRTWYSSHQSHPTPGRNYVETGFLVQNVT